MRKANRSPAWLRILTEPKTKGGRGMSEMSAHTLQLHISYQSSLAYPCVHKTRRDTSKSFFESVEQLDSLSRFFLGRNRNKAWANMNCHNNASMIYYFSESERSFLYMISTRMVEWYGTILLVWKLKFVFLKRLWHVFYMQITSLYSFHERMHAMAVLWEHILHAPKGISQQPSVMRSWLYDRHPLSIICPQALIRLLLGHLKYNHMFPYSSIRNVRVCKNKSWITKRPLPLTATVDFSKTDN